MPKSTIPQETVPQPFATGTNKQRKVIWQIAQYFILILELLDILWYNKGNVQEVHTMTKELDEKYLAALDTAIERLITVVNSYEAKRMEYSSWNDSFKLNTKAYAKALKTLNETVETRERFAKENELQQDAVNPNSAIQEAHKVFAEKKQEWSEEWTI